MIEGWAVVGLVAGFPVGLLVLMVVLHRFETDYVEPDERAAALADLVSSSQDPEEVEYVAAELLAPVMAGTATRPARER